MQPFIVEKRDNLRYIRLVSHDGSFHKSISVDHAKKLSDDVGMDLVCFTLQEKQELPLCKIIDYGKWKYQQSKTEKKENNEHKNLVKEIRFTPVIGDHDVQHKLNQVIQFLSEGDEVLLTMRFKGIHKRLFPQGEEKMNEIVEMCSEYGTEVNRKKTGNQIVVRIKRNNTKG